MKNTLDVGFTLFILIFAVSLAFFGIVSGVGWAYRDGIFNPCLLFGMVGAFAIGLIEFLVTQAGPRWMTDWYTCKSKHPYLFHFMYNRALWSGRFMSFLLLLIAVPIFFGGTIFLHDFRGKAFARHNDKQTVYTYVDGWIFALPFVDDVYPVDPSFRPNQTSSANGKVNEDKEHRKKIIAVATDAFRQKRTVRFDLDGDGRRDQLAPLEGSSVRVFWKQGEDKKGRGVDEHKEQIFKVENTAECYAVAPFFRPNQSLVVGCHNIRLRFNEHGTPVGAYMRSPGCLYIFTFGSDRKLVGETRIQMEWNPRSLATGDFNGDGLIDLAVAQSIGYHVNIFLNTGKELGPPTTFWSGDKVSEMVAIDPDNDGNLDLFCLQTAHDGFTFLKGDGNGNFDPEFHKVTQEECKKILGMTR